MCVEKPALQFGQTRIQAPKKFCETSAPACPTPTLCGSSLWAWGGGGSSDLLPVYHILALSVMSLTLNRPLSLCVSLSAYLPS